MKAPPKSAVLFSLADHFPGLARHALWLWVHAQLLFGRTRNTNHWIVNSLVKRLQVRIPVHTRLGNGMKIKVHLGDHVGGEIIRSGYYEADSIRVLQRVVKPGMVFVDVGTHVGQYSLVASELVGSSGAVHAFEPDPETYRWLTQNVERNRLTNVYANQKALGEAPGTLTLYLSDVGDIGSNSLREPRSFNGRVCKVECVTLDGYLESQRVPRVDIMKIDVEGAEYAVLSGARALLERDDRPIIILEFEEARQLAFQSSCARLAKLLQGNRYDLFRLDRPTLEQYVPKEHDALSFNVLAVPSGRPAVMADLGRVLQ